MVTILVNLLDRAVQFLEDSVTIIATMSAGELVLFLWPFLFLELPRHLLTELWYLGSALNKPESDDRLWFALKLAREKPLVSVLLPGYNEAETLEHSILSLREQSYPNIEIIVVNDGSTDDMGKVAEQLAERGWVRFFHFSARAGKSAATNFALEAARGEFVVICDCDTTYDNDAIWHLLVEFHDPQVSAVGGHIRVRNAYTNLLTRCQALQYAHSIGTGRRVLSELDMLSIVSGAFGAFRRSALKQFGSGDPGPGEDADITLKTRISGGRIAFAPRAVCMTDAPDTWWGYWKQQLRWNRDTARLTLLKYHWFVNPFHEHFRVTNLLVALDILVFQLIFAVIFPYYLVWLYLASDIFWHIMTIVLILYVSVSYLHFSIALALSERPREDIRLFPYIPLYPLFLGVYLRFARLYAYVEEILVRGSTTDNYVPHYVRQQTRKFPW